MEEKKLLLKLARLRIWKELGVTVENEKEIREQIVSSHALQLLCGAFVTLKERDHLRGCIGTMTGRMPLHETVDSMAVSSAFNDPRFTPVTKNEIKNISIEISVLSPMKAIEDPFSITPGVHGLYLTCGSHSGVLLPQVATEQNWGIKEFVHHTCYKAGMTPDILKDSRTRFQSFTVIMFSEEDLL